MSSSSRVTDIDVGTPPYPQEWENIRVHFHNFKDEIQKQNTGVSNYIESQKFDCCGTEWHIDVWYDHDESDDNNIDNNDDQDIQFSLWKDHRSVVVCIDYEFSIKDLDGRCVLNEKIDNESISPEIDIIQQQQPPKLSYLVDPSNNILVDGTLTIELSMKVHNPNPSTLPCKPFIPTNPINTLMPSMFNDEETADCYSRYVRKRN